MHGSTPVGNPTNSGRTSPVQQQQQQKVDNDGDSKVSADFKPEGLQAVGGASGLTGVAVDQAQAQRKDGTRLQTNAVASSNGSADA